MTKLSFKPACQLVFLLTVSLSLLGCTGPLEQQTRTVKVAPVSETYKLNKRLEGKVYILLAETSTGQEQHRYAVSDSLARALEKSTNGLTTLSVFGLAGKSHIANVSNENLEVLSFSDLANQLNENGISAKLAEMKQFYQENGMFKKTDLEFLADEIGADYLIHPCLIDIRRWGAGRFSMFGLKIVNTQVVSGVVSMEIWNVRTGHKVFAATSDVTIAGERIAEQPISLEEALERAWFGIIAELSKSREPDRVMAAAMPTPPDNRFSETAEENELPK